MYRTPQVVPQPLPFTLVRTDIAGFVGFCERGPLPIAEDFPDGKFDPTEVALKITSWKQFRTKFGGFLSYGFLAYAVRAFFENGGDACYVVRVATDASRGAADSPKKASLTLPSGPPALLGKIGKVVSDFETEFTPDSKDALPVAGDLVLLQGDKFSQLNVVDGTPRDGALRFAEKLDTSMPAGIMLARFPAGAKFFAASRGSWGNRIQIQITPLDAGAFALRASIDRGPDTPPREAEFYRRLTFQKDPKQKKDPNYAGTILQQQSNLIRLEPGAETFTLSADRRFESGQLYLRGGSDGLSQVTLRDFTGGSDELRGLRLLEEIDEISTLCIPDAVYRDNPMPIPPAPPVDLCQEPPTPLPEVAASDLPKPLIDAETVQLQQLMIDHCQRLRYRVALIDPLDELQIKAMQTWPAKQGLITRFSHYAAVYYPWLKVPDELNPEKRSRRVPPSGAVAGAYARNDLDPILGVQHPPANLELNWVTDVVQSISDAQQGELNQNNVNAIRAFPGRGIRIWGARSLADDAHSDWRFIHVRRLMSAIEETLERYGRWAVFRNNDIALRTSLKHSLEVMLQGIWAKGGLKGGKPDQAFYVKCDATNNPQNVIDRGRLICEIGVAVAAPMEFLVFEIRQDASGTQVVEN